MTSAMPLFVVLVRVHLREITWSYQVCRDYQLLSSLKQMDYNRMNKGLIRYIIACLLWSGEHYYSAGTE